MSALAEHVENYLRVRRALGFKLVGEGRLLAEFVAFADAAGHGTVTTSVALEWARLPRSASPNYLSRRLRAVRGFARYLKALDPACEVPPLELLPASKQRPAPYLFSDGEILALMAAARRLRPPLRAATFQTLIGLLACTGLRIGEAIRLDRGDIDHQRNLITVVESKFGKSRELAVHATTTAALRAYLARRDRPVPVEPTEALFTSATGTRLTYCNVHLAFKRIVAHAGLVPRSTVCRPRPHDLRHAFAVDTLLDAYRHDGGDGQHIQARIALLCTYLGHVNPGSTYWYLQAAPELLALAADRLERVEEGAR
jgi:integrase